MNLMNGKEIWCKPAATRTRKIPKVEAEESNKSLLSEFPALIDAAIKRGLVIRPDPVPREIGKSSVYADCKKCGKQYTQSKFSTLTKCRSCRIEPNKCKVCGKWFQPKAKAYLICGIECRKEVIKQSAIKRSQMATSQRPALECLICKASFTPRWARSGKLTKTCGESCAKILRANRMREVKRKL